MSRVLVTGGAGFIGSHVVDQLIAAGHQPRILDLRASQHHAPSDVHTVLADIRDLAAVRAAMVACDAVVHLAAAADVGEVAAAPVEAEELNARGTLHVLQAARDAGIRRVIYASTIWVYSDTEAESVDEDSALRPPPTCTRQPSSPASCTAAPTPSCTGWSARSCASASPTGRGPVRPRSFLASSPGHCAASR